MANTSQATAADQHGAQAVGRAHCGTSAARVAGARCVAAESSASGVCALPQPGPPARSMHSFPTAVLFADIVDSTRRAFELGDSEWLDLQEAQQVMACREIRRFGGTSLSIVGDGMVASFAGAAAALRCAVRIAEGSRAMGIQVRMGIHFGRCERRGRRLGGIVFHIGSRLADVARAGEVVVSRMLKEVVTEPGFLFARRGTHRLRGLPGRWPLYTVTCIPRGEDPAAVREEGRPGPWLR